MCRWLARMHAHLTTCPCCTAATQSINYGKLPAVLVKSPGSPRVLLRPGRRGDFGDDSIRASPDVVGQVRGLSEIVAGDDIADPIAWRALPAEEK